MLEKLKQLKQKSGTHSPSIDSIRTHIPELSIKIDACFLSNPYATDLFLKYLTNDLISAGLLRDVLEFYPPQNRSVASYISKSIGIDSENIFVGNGAIEAIQAVLQYFVHDSLCVITPTFSSYYEFANDDCKIYFYELLKENDFNIDVPKYVKYIIDNKIKNIVIINPNNPNGGYLTSKDIVYILEKLKNLETIILDESFIHFAYEDKTLSQISSENLVNNYPNLVVIKSMSKDFGIAGIRAGYAVMNSNRVNVLLQKSFLWNVSGLANYFFKIYSDQTFIEEYNVARKKYIVHTNNFFEQLNQLENCKVYSSKANFALLEITNNMTSFDFTSELLVKHGIYVRDCSDKIGLNGEFIRVASRTNEENKIILNALKSIK